jgi:branched-chain amino acid transport system permease protein
MINIDLLVNGLITGVFYALMAVGLSLVYGILRIVNFAHGEFYMLGAYAYVLASANLGLPLPVSLLLAVLLGIAVGFVAERILIRPLYASYSTWAMPRNEYAVIVTFALSLFLVNSVNLAVGPWSFKGEPLSELRRIEFGPILLNGHRLVACIVGLAVLGGLFCLLKWSYWGRAVRAVAQNRMGATLAGIDPSRVSVWIFALSAGLAALAGGLLSPLINPAPDVGIFPAVKSFAIVVLGGMGSLAGAFVGGLILGVVETLAAYHVSFAYRDAYGLILLVLIFLFRPQGLFGEVRREV